MNDQVESIVKAPLETRMRWYAVMNTWRIPEDFPVKLPDFGSDHRAQYRNRAWKRAWQAVCNSLTEEQQSRGWWIYELRKTEEEWRAWWNARSAA